MQRTKCFSPVAELHPLLQVRTNSWFEGRRIEFLRFGFSGVGALCKLYGVTDAEGEVISKVVACSISEIHEFNRKAAKLAEEN